MKSLYTLLSVGLCAGVLSLSSCNDCTTSVVQFEESDNEWLVYSQQEELHMVDERDLEQDTVFIFKNSTIKSEQVPGEGFGVADACIEQYDTRRASVMQEVSAKKRLPGLSVVALKRPNDLQVSLVVINRGEFPIPDLNTPQYASLPINGVTYQNVFKIVNPDSSSNGVSRILFNKEYGFLKVVYHQDSVLNNKVLVRKPQ
jgi:hypothetical protein